MKSKILSLRLQKQLDQKAGLIWSGFQLVLGSRKGFREESESIIRRAFASEKRTKERAPDSSEAPVIMSTQASPSVAHASPTFAAGMIPLDQVLAMGLDTQSIELLQNHRIDPEALSIPWPATDWRKDLAKLVEIAFHPDETIDFKMSNTP